MKRKGFTLIELIVILTIIFILVGIATWRLGLLRTNAKTVATSDIVATLQRMQQLADVEGITVTNTDVVLRIVELQASLAKKGDANFVLDPVTIGSKVSYTIDVSNGTTHWAAAPTQ